MALLQAVPAENLLCSRPSPPPGGCARGRPCGVSLQRCPWGQALRARPWACISTDGPKADTRSALVETSRWEESVFMTQQDGCVPGNHLSKTRHSVKSRPGFMEDFHEA